MALKELNFISPTPTQFQAFRNEVIALKFVDFHITIFNRIVFFNILIGKLHIRTH